MKNEAKSNLQNLPEVGTVHLDSFHQSLDLFGRVFDPVLVQTGQKGKTFNLGRILTDSLMS